jgi:hypothetical protein
MGARHPRRAARQLDERLSQERPEPRGQAVSATVRRFLGWSMVMLSLSCCACANGEREAAERAAPAPIPGGSLTTDTDSRSIPDRQQRLAFLARYLRFQSPLVDAEFIIRYRDNGQGLVPGPSDWDIRAVLQVEGPASEWHAGWTPCPAQDPSNARQPDFDTAWAEPLLGRRAQWQALRSSPRCYRNPRSASSFLVVYEEDGVVLYRNTSTRD